MQSSLLAGHPSDGIMSLAEAWMPDDSQPLPSDALLEEIVMALVDRPEVVRVTEVRSEYGVTFNVTVAEGDKGKVIGKSYRCLRGLSELLGRIEAKTKHRAVTINVLS